MTIGFLLSTSSRAGAGMFYAPSALAANLVKRGEDVMCVAPREAFSTQDCFAFLPAKVKIFDPVYLPRFAYIPEAYDFCLAQDFKIVHLHGHWLYQSLLAEKLASSMSLPLVISSHGMLDPWALGNSWLKKRIAYNLFERKCLLSAFCMHALTPKEYEAFRLFGLKQPVAVIPNGVSIPDLEKSMPLPLWYENRFQSRKILLFLGRLHRKKGVFELLNAFNKIKRRGKGWMLVVAGAGPHEDELKHLASDIGLSTDDIIFTGELHGEEKCRTFCASDAFILPSFSEGLPMSVLEAMSYGLPCFISENCNMPDTFQKNVCLKISTNTECLARELGDYLALPDRAMFLLGQRAREHVSNKYCWTVVAEMFKRLYNWILHGGEKPEFIHYY